MNPDESTRNTHALRKPTATRIIAVVNQKGGVGKTTSTVNLSVALALGGLRVLAIDLDPQGNASTALALPHPIGTPNIYDALVDGKPLREVVSMVEGVEGDLSAVPATIDLAGAEVELVSVVAREQRLKRSIEAHLDEVDAEGRRYDYVLIDCPPSLGLLTLNALTAANEVLIPIQCEYYALEGLGQLTRTIDIVQTHLNADLKVGAILLTMFDARTKLSSQVIDEVRAHFGEAVLPTAIPRSVRVSEAPSYQQSVIAYDPTSTGASSYLAAARELAGGYADEASAVDGAHETTA